ncbi:MAG: fumarylacetoacetate hydrolase family protein [Hyphomicrobiaceae bacterium]|nr:fumarylacetoacetate hydrolase family protein [Hyphomicrobiaceae bacterium]
MKLVSYGTGDGAGYAIVAEGGNGPAEDATAIPVDGEFAARYPSIRAVLEGQAIGELEKWADGRDPSLKLSDVNFLSPLHDAEKVICIGVNYPKRHPVHGEMPPPEDITMFLKAEGALVGHLEDLEYPPEGPRDTFDYEGELVLVIGKEGRHIPKERAFDHIAGYTIMDDGSVRGWQKHSVTAGKNFVASGACGPWMATADEISDPSAIELHTRLNGEVVQNTTVASMIFDIPTMVNYVSTIMPLKPGDIISTGSPEGSGGSRQPQRFLVPGDELEISWSGIGTLKNRVAG